ncbi:MAG: formate dehydrogenase accessory sulfurtransferase FdhD [Candidatus Helarchaeota archaeon]
MKVLDKFKVTKIKNGKASEEIVDVVTEYTLNIKLNNISVASLVCLPINIKELAIGYLISEGLLNNINDIEIIKEILPNIYINTRNPVDNIELYTELRSSGCIGIKQTWDQHVEKVESSLQIDTKTIFTAQKILDEKCGIWKVSGGTHSAAIFSREGELIAFYEDIGRHNAIDKIIGHVYINRIQPNNCFLVSTGRQSAGMLLKMIRAKIPIVISNTAPIAQGIELARKFNITLICFAREPKLSVYSNRQRIII